jgi:hypothetical protein
VKFSFYVEAIFPVGIDARVACWPEMRNIGVIDRVAARASIHCSRSKRKRSKLTCVSAEVTLPSCSPVIGVIRSLVAPWMESRQPLTENVLACLDLESRFYAGSLESCFKWPSVKSTPIEVPGTETAKRPRKCSYKQKGSKWHSYAWQVHNERIHRQK